MTLADVPLNREAVLADGAIVRCAARINGVLFYRLRDHGLRRGPVPMPLDTPVAEILPMTTSYDRRGAVADPLAQLSPDSDRRRRSRT